MYATICSFYLPLIVMVVLYTKIYITARDIIEKVSNPDMLYNDSNLTVNTVHCKAEAIDYHRSISKCTKTTLLRSDFLEWTSS